MLFGYITRKSELKAEEIIEKLTKIPSKSLNSKIMSTYDSIIAKGRNEGVAQEKIQSKIEGIKKALKRGKLTFEEIAEDFDVSVEFVLKLKKEYML